MQTQNDRHAYLIMCHNNFQLLTVLLMLLDDERNDIYVHVDKKVADAQFGQVKEKLAAAVKRSGLVFVPRISVNWGGYSVTKATCLLLKAAVPREYAYYHLISGVDLPLKTQDELHTFFQENQGKEFIAFDLVQDERLIENRLRWYRFLWDHIGQRREWYISILRAAEKCSLGCQWLLRINRIPSGVRFCKGPNWFSITHGLACYIVDHEALIQKHFRYTTCSDEIFVQWLASTSPYRQNIINDCKRHVDWERGNPYTFTREDFGLLCASDCLFARKFDERTDMQIIQQLYGHLMHRAQR